MPSRLGASRILLGGAGATALARQVEAGNTYAYAYDNAGNRSFVNRNGQATTYTFNAANQVTNGVWSTDGRGGIVVRAARSHPEIAQAAAPQRRCRRAGCS